MTMIDRQQGKLMFSVGVALVVVALMVRIPGLTVASRVADDLAIGTSVLLVLIGFLIMLCKKETKKQ